MEELLSGAKGSTACLHINSSARREWCSTPLPLRRSQSDEFLGGSSLFTNFARLSQAGGLCNAFSRNKQKECKPNLGFNLCYVN